MAADIEFNVRNGMTVGSSKHLVLDVNGALSGSDITCTTGQFLSGDTDLLTVIDDVGYLTSADLTGYATETYVTTAISNVISGAPEALDTLNELASALNDDASFATNVTNSIATKWTQDNTKITNWDNTYTDVSTNSADWETAASWGNHADANYLTEYTVTVHDVTGHEASIEITESQITDLQSYLLASDIVSADNWSSAYTTVTANSASWASHTDVTGLSNTVATNSGNWDVTYATVTANSASWASHTDVTGLSSTVATNSGNWDVTYATVTAYSASWADGGTTTLSGATDANITSPAKGEILVYTNGSTQKWTNKADRAGLEEMYNYANIQFYNELSYSSTDSTVLTGVDVYVTSAKATHLFSREFVYSTTGTLTGVITTDEQNSNTLTKNMYYHTTTGALTSVTRSYT